MKEHKHAAVIRAYAAGHKIEYQSLREPNRWFPTDNPAFYDNFEYRVYEEPKPDVVKFNNVYPEGPSIAGHETLEIAKSIGIANKVIGRIKLTYDGNTGKLKAAEVVQ